MCDVISTSSNAFNTITVKLSEYISRTVQNAGEFLKAINPENFGFEQLIMPADPAADATNIVHEKWKIQYRNWDIKT